MDSSSSSPFAMTAALDWLGGAITGALGTSVAILGVAAVGFAMLQGRLPIRRGVLVVLGCFILFSSRAIATGLLGAMTPPLPPELPRPVPERPTYIAPTPPPVAYDPYAGASVPVRPADDARDLLPR